ncbi:hypothetical protein [Caballeronia sordidicola]|uniref:hypothetical protein n=1 Tax=Caballeronia TaxID=1827195 RepID=UPI0012FD16C9|nr:hypothetical protein [Caballeronia sordidicola]
MVLRKRLRLTFSPLNPVQNGQGFQPAACFYEAGNQPKFIGRKNSEVTASWCNANIKAPGTVSNRPKPIRRSAAMTYRNKKLLD